MAGSGAVALAALVGVAIAAPPGHAQPAPDAEINRARDLYKSAEAAMKDGRFDDAARDYGAAYESSKDPALFFKIGRANERAGKCDVAVIYYARYLREGKPSAQFVAATEERMAACGAVTDHGAGAVVVPRPGDAGEASSAPPTRPPGAAGNGGAPPVGPHNGPASGAPTPAGATPARTGNALAAGPDSAAAGAPEVAATAAPALAPDNRGKVAWILTGGSIAMVTLAGVLAYASSSSENDVRDLYVGFAGQPATFDPQTQRKYNDLVDQGRRYQHLSWAAFGLAGATAVGAAVLFVLGGQHESAHARVTPVVAPDRAGVAVAF